MGCDMFRGMDCTILLFIIVILLIFFDNERDFD